MFFFKQKTAYEMRISDWSSDVCSSDLVHAGVLAKWDIQKTLGLAAEVEEALRGPDWKKMLHSMYGNEPVHWKDEFSGSKRIRVIINAFTRMRMCNSHGHMEFSHKGAPTHDADGLMPWFDMPGRSEEHTSELQSLMRISYAVFCLKK